MLRQLTAKKLIGIDGAIRVEVESCEDAMSNLANTQSNPDDFALIALRADHILGYFFKNISSLSATYRHDEAGMLSLAIVAAAKLTHLMIAASDELLVTNIHYHDEYQAMAQELLRDITTVFSHFSFDVVFFILNKLNVWRDSHFIRQRSDLLDRVDHVIEEFVKLGDTKARDFSVCEEVLSTYQNYSRYCMTHIEKAKLTSWVDDYFASASQAFKRQENYIQKFQVLVCVDQAFTPLQRMLSIDRLRELVGLYKQLVSEFKDSQAEYRLAKMAKNFGAYLHHDIAFIVMRSMIMLGGNYLIDATARYLLPADLMDLIWRRDMTFFVLLNCSFITGDFCRSRFYKELRLPIPLSVPEWVNSELLLRAEELNDAVDTPSTNHGVSASMSH